MVLSGIINKKHLKMKIIIVDDNVAFRSTLKDYLENKLGHIVIGEASSAEEFLVTASAYEADIILMDIEMYGINGIEATHQLNISNPSTKVIAVTMHTEKVFLLQLILNGFRGCVYKTELYDMLESALNKVFEGKLSFPKNIKVRQL
jgi:DNA-binding NarL/FixJ family response regulator